MTRRHRKLGIILLSIGLASVVAAAIFNSWLQRRLEEKIHNAIPGHRIEFSSAQLSLLRSSIDVKDILFRLDTTSIKDPHEIFFSRVEIRGIHFWNWIREKKLMIDSINVDGGEISLNERLVDFFKSRKDSMKFLSGELPVRHFSINILKVDYAKGYYKYQIKNINTDGNAIFSSTIDTVKIIPLYSKEEFNRRTAHQSDRIESMITGVSIKNIQLSALFQGHFNAGVATIENCRFYAFRDRRLPREKDLQPLPMGMIKKLPFSVRVNAFKVLNGSITYEEYPKEGEHSGTLRIEHAKISISPFINRPQASDPSYMVLKSQGSLMGSGSVYTVMRVPLHSDDYYVNGAFHNLQLTTLNDASEHLGKIHIESGLLDSLGFEFKFDALRSTGKIVGIYHGLIIQPLKKNNKPSKLKSFALRRFIIPLNKEGSLPERKRTGRIDYARDPTRKFSFYLLQSLLTGIKASFRLGFLLPN